MNGLAIKRRNIGLSQQQLGMKIGVRQNTVSTWEKGSREPSTDKLKKLADIFQCTIEELL